MPEMVVGWCTHCWAAIGGGKLYISGVAGLYMPIWDILAPQGERVGARERSWGDRFENYVPIRQAVPVGLARARFCSWARWAQFFIKKKVYYSRYNLFTHNILFYKPPGRREWMDGIQCIWMTLSQLGRYSQLGLLGLGFAAGLVGLGFS
jgi:hypothetical protein